MSISMENRNGRVKVLAEAVHVHIELMSLGKI